MSGEAAEVVEHLAQQAQLLASLHSLSTLHVFASIPLGQTAAIQDVADVLGIPYNQLLRLIRFTATSGFLHEPQQGLVEHTALSAQFVKKPFLVDAVTFLSDIALPAALQTSKTTHLWSQSSAHPKQTAYNLVTQSKISLSAECERHPKLKRQVHAYQRLRRNTFDDTVTEVLSTLNWTNLGDATVVQVGPPSTTTARALSSQNPGLHFVVQLSDRDAITNSKNGRVKTPADSFSHLTKYTDPRIQVSYRARGDLQPVKDAQVYMLYLPGYSLSQRTTNVLADTAAEIRIHFGVLRANPGARLILIAELLPDPGTVETKVEAAARTHDLFLMQLVNGGLFGMAQLQELLSNTRDEKGKLFIVNHVSSRHGSTTVSQVTIKDG